MSDLQRIREALLKPLPTSDEDIGDGFFNPWHDVIEGVSGSYASESDVLMIEALTASLERTTFEKIKKHGFVFEFALYVLAGHDLTDYGTSPRGGWPTDEKLTRDLIEKWKGYYEVVWEEKYPEEITFNAN